MTPRTPKRGFLPGRGRGLSIVELVLFMLVMGIVSAFVVRFFWNTRRMHEQQVSNTALQSSFLNLCDHMEKDLNGCRTWRIQRVLGGAPALFIDRVEGEIVYDVKGETGEIARTASGGLITFPFKGDLANQIPTLEMDPAEGDPSALNFRVSLPTTPPIEFRRVFHIRISSHQDPDFFKTQPLGGP